MRKLIEMAGSRLKRHNGGEGPAEAVPVEPTLTVVTPEADALESAADVQVSLEAEPAEPAAMAVPVEPAEPAIRFVVEPLRFDVPASPLRVAGFGDPHRLSAYRAGFAPAASAMPPVAPAPPAASAAVVQAVMQTPTPSAIPNPMPSSAPVPQTAAATGDQAISVPAGGVPAQEAMPGHSNGHVNGQVNGHANGSVNGHVNGSANGHVNGHVNGHGPAHPNGHARANGHAGAQAVGHPVEQLQALTPEPTAPMGAAARPSTVDAVPVRASAVTRAPAATAADARAAAAAKAVAMARALAASRSAVANGAAAAAVPAAAVAPVASAPKAAVPPAAITPKPADVPGTVLVSNAEPVVPAAPVVSVAPVVPVVPVVPAVPAVPAVPQAAAPQVASTSGPQSRQVELHLDALAQKGFITRSDLKGAVVEQFRVIKRPLINNALGRGVAPLPQGNLIMVTSALPGEGKSFTSINLALSIAAEVDNTVLLVDADVSKPSIQSSLGLESGPGLLDVLTGRCAMHEAILRTNIPKLTVMQAGTQQERATEMLSSGAMARMLEEMASRYSDRIVIFDLPPLLPTTEARVLAGHAGQLVLVVSSSMTTEAQLRDAIATVESVPVKMMVLNKAAPGGHGEHGYGYGYGYSYSRRADPSPVSTASHEEPAEEPVVAAPDRTGVRYADSGRSTDLRRTVEDSPAAASRRPSLLGRMISGRGGRDTRTNIR